MSRLFKFKHEAFCRAYVRGPTAGNFTASYEAAGFARDTSNASRLAAEPHIQDRIAELVAENEATDDYATAVAARAAAVDKTSVLVELKKIGFSNMLDYLHLDDDERLQVDLSRLDHDKGAAIRDIRINYDDKTQRVKNVALKLYDKRFALTGLGRHLGLPAGPPAEAPKPEPSIEEMHPRELDERLTGIFAKLAASHVDVQELLDRAIAQGKVKIAHGAKPLREIETVEDAIARNKARFAAETAVTS